MRKNINFPHKQQQQRQQQVHSFKDDELGMTESDIVLMRLYCFAWQMQSVLRFTSRSICIFSFINFPFSQERASKTFRWNSICISLKFTFCCSIQNRFHAIIKVLLASRFRFNFIICLHGNFKFGRLMEIHVCWRENPGKAKEKMIIGCDRNRWKKQKFPIRLVLGCRCRWRIWFSSWNHIEASHICVHTHPIQIHFQTFPSSSASTFWLKF